MILQAMIQFDSSIDNDISLVRLRDLIVGREVLASESMKKAVTDMNFVKEWHIVHPDNPSFYFKFDSDTDPDLNCVSQLIQSGVILSTFAVVRVLVLDGNAYPEWLIAKVYADGIDWGEATDMSIGKKPKAKLLYSATSDEFGPIDIALDGDSGSIRQLGFIRFDDINKYMNIKNLLIHSAYYAMRRGDYSMNETITFVQHVYNDIIRTDDASVITMSDAIREVYDYYENMNVMYPSITRVIFNSDDRSKDLITEVLSRHHMTSYVNIDVVNAISIYHKEDNFDGMTSSDTYHTKIKSMLFGDEYKGDGYDYISGIDTVCIDTISHNIWQYYTLMDKYESRNLTMGQTLEGNQLEIVKQKVGIKIIEQFGWKKYTVNGDEYYLNGMRSLEVDLDRSEDTAISFCPLFDNSHEIPTLYDVCKLIVTSLEDFRDIPIDQVVPETK